MKKEYDTSVKEAIERVMSVFSEYIKTTPYFDIVWSGKVGYIYISIDSCRGTVGIQVSKVVLLLPFRIPNYRKIIGWIGW